MAFVSNDQEDEENQNSAQNPSQGPVAPGGGGSAVHLAPTSGVGSTGASGAPPSANGAPAAGGSFATLDKYVGANQGQAEGLANNITSGIGAQYNTLNSGNASTLSGIQGNVNDGYTAEDQGVLSAENADPVSFTSNPGNIASFQGQLNDQYTGPSSAESDAGYQTQQSNINNAISEGNAATQTEAGRAGLLQQNEAAPTKGVTALNSAILSQDPAAQGQIENAYQPFSNLLTGLSTGAQGIDASIANAQGQASDASSTAKSQLDNQFSGLNTALTGQTATAGTNAQNQQQQTLAADTAGENSVNSAISAFENSVQNGSNYPGLPSAPFSSNFFNNIGMGPFAAGPVINPNAPTTAQSATPDQYALGSSLQQLGGSAYSDPLPATAPDAYNAFLSNPSLTSIISPSVNPLVNEISNYENVDQAGPNQAGFSAGPTEANTGLNGQEAGYVSNQFQSLLNAILAANGNAPVVNGTPAQPVGATPTAPPVSPTTPGIVRGTPARPVSLAKGGVVKSKKTEDK